MESDILFEYSQASTVGVLLNNTEEGVFTISEKCIFLWLTDFTIPDKGQPGKGWL
jgi:hypothetical protein